jgi:hypothetical protein
MNYELLADCIRSGQLSAQQIAEIMRDEVFKAWFKVRYANPV